MAKDGLTWELVSYEPGAMWHDRRGDTPCTRVVLGTPYTPREVGDPDEVVHMTHDALGDLLGEIRRYNQKETRDRVRSKRLSVIYFDFQPRADGRRWTLSFKIKDGMGGVSVREIIRYLDSVNLLGY